MSRQPTACNDCGRVKKHLRYGLCWSCKKGLAPREVGPDMAARIEDIEWMTQHGEHIERIAARVGLTVGSLDVFLRDHGRADLLHNMKAST